MNSEEAKIKSNRQFMAAKDRLTRLTKQGASAAKVRAAYQRYAKFRGKIRLKPGR